MLALGQPADLYLIDEPSAYMDSEQRIVAAKVIKRFVMHAKKTAFIVEHDFIMATYMADRCSCAVICIELKLLLLTESLCTKVSRLSTQLHVVHSLSRLE